MKRAVTLSAGALVLALSLSACITVNVPSRPDATNPPAATNGSSDDDFANAVTMPCSADGITLSELTAPVIVSGECPSVTIEGSNFDVRIEKTASLTIRGDDNDVDVDEVGTIIVNGQDNDVDVTQSGITVVEIAGNDNSVSTRGDIGGVVINGNENDIEFAGTLGEKAENGTGNTFGDD